MKTKRGLLVIPVLLMLLFPSGLFAQLSGTYTIGGVSPDYATITDAANALSAGISGPVVFNIRSGVYNEEVYIYYITGYSSVNTVTFQSEALDSTAVTITTNLSSVFTVETSDKIIFRELTFNGIGNWVLYFPAGGELYNCIVTGGYHSLYAGGGLIMDHNDIGSRINVHDAIAITNNRLRGNVFFSSSPSCQIINNVCDSLFEFGSSSGSIIKGNSVGGILSCFSSGSCIYKDNIVFDRMMQGGNNCVIEGNEIHGKLSSYSDYMKIIGNSVGDYLNVGSYSLIKGNKITNDCYIHGHDSVINNLIGGNFGCTFYDYNVICFNNFSSKNTGYFDCSSSRHNTIENNIMPAAYYGPLTTNIIHNNNYPWGGGMYDSHPFYINPEYISTTDLHATNLQLRGRGKYYPKVSYDIDSAARANPPSIGANEVCISSDTLKAFCGDSIVLAFCTLPPTGSFTWHPATGLNDVHLATPALSVSASDWYVILDSVSGYTDSVYVEKIAFNLTAGLEDSIKCGQNAALYATYNAGASYQWTPTDSLNDPYSHFTAAHPSQTTTYIVTATVPGCPISSDTVTIVVDPLPTAYVYLDSVNYNYFLFLNASSCADTYYWDFGDSTQSTDVNPAHIYLSADTFWVTLIACNSFGCDTMQGYIVVDTVVFTGISLQTPTGNSISIYPNPATNELHLTLTKPLPPNTPITITDMQGRVVKEVSKITPGGDAIDVSTLTQGIYLLKLNGQVQRFVKM